MFMPGIDEACYLVPGPDKAMLATGDWLDEAVVAPGIHDGADGVAEAGLVIASRAGNRSWLLAMPWEWGVPL